MDRIAPMNGENTVLRRAALPRRVLLLLTSRSYRSRAFIEAATTLEIEVVKAVNMEEYLAEYWDYRLGLDFSNVEKSVTSIVNYSKEKPIGGILSVDDSGSLLAAKASEALGIPHNSSQAAAAARNKLKMRQIFEHCPVNSPKYALHHFSEGMKEKAVQAIAESCTFPCVIKPLSLSGSRGVIRADDQDQLRRAIARLGRLLVHQDPSPAPKPFLIEDFVPGFEVALEGILDGGRLHVMALFDKPDPLDGPYFEETIYVTPSRLALEIQKSITASVATAAEGLGLREGPVHAEVRVNESGPWIIEVAGRSIGGLCSKTLRFADGITLEELILRQAFGMHYQDLIRENRASGVMMLPIPEMGILKGILGCEEARAIPLVENVEITAKINYPLRPLPEGDSYLGFIFARGDTPEEVEAALRLAHEKLSFTIAPELTVLPTGV